MAEATDAMTVGQLAARAGVTSKTVRYYEKLGLMPAPPRTRSGYRRYGDHELFRLRFIGKAKRLGLSLAEIGEILRLSGRGDDPCSHVVALLDLHVMQIDETLTRLTEFRDQLAELRDRSNEAANGRVCGIIEHATVEWAPLSFDRPLVRRR